jgi:hypothetical protein
VFLLLALAAKSMALVPMTMTLRLPSVGDYTIGPPYLFVSAALVGAVAIGSLFLEVEKRLTDQRKP